MIGRARSSPRALVLPWGNGQIYNPDPICQGGEEDFLAEACRAEKKKKKIAEHHRYCQHTHNFFFFANKSIGSEPSTGEPPDTVLSILFSCYRPTFLLVSRALFLQLQHVWKQQGVCRLAPGRCGSDAGDPRSPAVGYPLPPGQEGCQRGHQGSQPQHVRDCHSCGRRQPAGDPLAHPAAVRGQEHAVRLCAQQGAARPRLRCEPRRHCCEHQHERGERPGGPHQGAQGQGGAPGHLSWGFC